MTRAALAGRVLEPGLCGSRLHGGYTAGDVVNRSCNRHATRDAAAWGRASPGKPGRALPDQARQSCWARSASMGGGKQPMSQQSSGPAGPGRGDWPDNLWPDENDDGANEGTRPAPSMPAGRPGDGPARRRFNPVTLAVVVVLAVVAGAAIALALRFSSGSPATSATSGSQGSGLGPGAGGQPGAGSQPGGGTQIGPGGGFPGGGSGPGGQAFMIGQVLKVSATSITIGGPGHTITAAVTSSTRTSGKVSAISGIKVGDQVSAQISISGGKATLLAIQDPAQTPSGGVPGG